MKSRAKIPVDIADLRATALRSIDSVSRDIINAAKTVYSTPETGFNEHRTSVFVQKKLEGLGFKVETGIARTGMKALLKGGKSGPTVAVIAESDSLHLPSHPGADSETGAAHACGHHTQVGSVLGVAAALSVPEIKASLVGNVVFVITPAEEFIEIENRLALRESGELEFLSGKQEMIRLGTFDDIDMAMMVHSSAGSGNAIFSVGGTSNAHVSHQVRYLGRSAHAGGAPDKGVNALQAAMLANEAINTQRETFKESDVVRVHGIISSGGDAVNAVPDEVLYEGRVRAKSIEAIKPIAERIVRCYRAGALAMGASVEVRSIAGYHPLKQNAIMQKLFASNAELILGRDSVSVFDDTQTHGGSTDMGDLSTIMPVIHPYANAATGTGHGIDYIIEDYDRGVVSPAKVMTATLLSLLADGSQAAKKVLDQHRPSMTTEQYVETQRQRFTVETYDPS